MIMREEVVKFTASFLGDRKVFNESSPNIKKPLKIEAECALFEKTSFVKFAYFQNYNYKLPILRKICHNRRDKMYRTTLFIKRKVGTEYEEQNYFLGKSKYGRKGSSCILGWGDGEPLS